MRLFITIILAIWISNCSAQTRKVKVFEDKEYMSGTVLRQTKGRIEIENELIDVYFFKRRFQSPDYLPDTLTNARYKDQKILLWRDPNGVKDFERNWTYTYSYDSIGRVINFAKSTCMLCSSIGYDYSIAYNSNGQVALITANNSSKCFKFSYDKKGDVSKFEEYWGEELAREITLR